MRAHPNREQQEEEEEEEEAVNFNFPYELMGLWGVVGILIVAVGVVVHVVFALAVFNDSGALVHEGKKTVLVGPGIWGAATLIGGVFVAAAYWVMHHSALQSGLEIRRPAFRSKSGKTPTARPGRALETPESETKDPEPGDQVD